MYENAFPAAELRNQMNFLNNIMDRISNALRADPRGNYIRALEEESARLRAENRALLNSLLGTAGIPPLDPQTRPAGPMNMPTRRRSWPQIAAEREVAAATRGATMTRDAGVTRHRTASRDAATARDVSATPVSFNHRPIAPTEKTQ